jgi:hypothetical protein
MKIKRVVVSYGYSTRTSKRTSQPTFCTTTTEKRNPKKYGKKKYGEKSTGIYGGKVRGKVT